MSDPHQHDHEHSCSGDHSHDHTQSNSHDHDHGHAGGFFHSHSHEITNYSRAFVIGIALNLIYVVIEMAYGFFSHSLALIADAGHNFSDVVGLALALVAIKLSDRKPSSKYTYGLKRTSILASLANAVLLLVSVGVILLESVKKLITPDEVQSNTMIGVATVGIVINTATALMFMRGQKEDLNVKGAYLHLVADALLSVGVVLTGIAIRFTGWNILDPIMGILISLVIIAGTWSLLKDSVNLAVDAVPEKIKHHEVKAYLQSVSGVVEVHDLHIWGMSTTEVALTAHIVIEPMTTPNAILEAINHTLKEKHGIGHSTVQIEFREANFKCELKPDEVV